nr:glycosyltransferase family 39 protein [uncultured Dyadobacter sp.]
MLQKDLFKIAKWALPATILIWFAGWLTLIPEGMPAQIAALAADLLKNKPAPGQSDLSEPVVRLSADAMRILGKNGIALHLPGFIAILISLYSTFRVAKSFFSAEAGLLAVLILATSQATFFVNNDIGDSTYLAACYIFMLWQILTFIEAKKAVNLILAIAGAVCVATIKNSSPDSSFPRISTDPILTLLITFTPWTIFLILALLDFFRRILPREYEVVQKHEVATMLAFIMPFTFSYLNPLRSTFDIYMAFPVGAVLTSSYIVRIVDPVSRHVSALLGYLHAVAAYAWVALLFCLVWFSFPANNYFGLIHFMALLSILTWLVFFSAVRQKLIIGCVIFAIGSNLVLTTYFYPNIAEYRAGAKLGILARSNGAKEGHLFSYQAGMPYSLRFYAGVDVIENSDFGQLVATKGCLVYTHQNFLDEFRAIRPDLKILGTSYDYPGRVWDMRFLDPAERNSVVNAKVLIRL